VMAEMRPLVDEMRVDAMGNVIGIKNGATKTKVMLAAHMDEIGFLVKHIDSNGYLRVQPVGGHDPSVLVAQRVLVHTEAHGALRGVLTSARKPIHLQKEKAEGATTLNDLFVDLGLRGEQVKAQVEIGDFVTMDRTLEVVGDCVISKALDDRSGLFVMLEALRRVGDQPSATVYAVATVQEEVGLRGAQTAAYAVDADIAIALDTTLAIEMPGSGDHEAVTKLGEGVAIKIMDSGHIAHPKLMRHLRDIARHAGIPHQMEVLPGGSTDAAAMQRSRHGTASATLSLPSRYVHTVNEMVHLGDLEADIALLTAYLREVRPEDYAL
ncbi:MAG: M42 family metallopeptidase, partial [Ktedonobacterales bacterium]|nr:M42 family metallopeptidase [Ktedonobacterales bacterium]